MTDQGPSTGRPDQQSRRARGGEAFRAIARACRGAGALLRPRLVALATTTGEPPAARRRLVFGVELATTFNLAMAVVVLAATYAQLDSVNGSPDPPFGDAAMLSAAAALAVPAVLRDRLPPLAWTISLLANVAVNLVAYLVSAPNASVHPYPDFYAGGVIVFLCCQYTLATRMTPTVLAAAWVTGTVTAALVQPAHTLTAAVLVAVPSVLGSNVRSRRRAQHRLVEQERRHQEERAVLEERQRIARELHDVVAHHMSVIAIQAEAAPYRVPDPPRELTDSFAGIRTSALDGLTELRRILGVLRAEDTTGETAPQPGLERMGELVDSARAAGLTVTTATTGPPRPLPPAAGLSAYRILQESLSNAMRHAPRSSVHVEIGYGERDVRIKVDNGPGAGRPSHPRPDARGPGHGLVGMRERVALLGGTLAAAPTPGGGFTVEASLPAGADDGEPRRATGEET